MAHYRSLSASCPTFLICDLPPTTPPFVVWHCCCTTDRIVFTVELMINKSYYHVPGSQRNGADSLLKPESHQCDAVKIASYVPVLSVHKILQHLAKDFKGMMQDNQYIYMRKDIPLVFQIWLYSGFDTGSENAIFHISSTLSLSVLPEEILSSFWKDEKAISSRSRQSSWWYVFERYIQDIKLTQQQKHVKKDKDKS